MAKLGLNSASIDLTQPIWFWVIFSWTLFWQQEEQISVCSQWCCNHSQIYFYCCHVDVISSRDLGHWFIFLLRRLCFSAVKEKSLHTGGLCNILWLRPDGSDGYRQPDSVSHFTAAEATTGLHSLRGNIITHSSTQTWIFILQKVRSLVQIPRVWVGKLKE